MVKFTRHRRSVDLPGRRSSSSQSIGSSQESSTMYKISRTLSSSRLVDLTRDTSSVDSTRSKNHHLTLHRRKASSLLFVVVLVIAGLVWMIMQLTASVLVSTNDKRLVSTVDMTIYSKAISGYLDSHPITRMRAFLDTETLRQSLASSYPEIKKITDNGKPNINQTEYVVTFRKPLAGWKINEKQYYVDSEGISFEKNYFESPGVQIVDESGVKIEKGGLVASSRFLSFVGRVVAEAAFRGYEVIEAKIPADTTRQLEIKIKNITPAVKLSIDRGVGAQIEDMDVALKYLIAAGRYPEYIDVRVSGKAFYR